MPLNVIILWFNFIKGFLLFHQFCSQNVAYIFEKMVLSVLFLGLLSVSQTFLSRCLIIHRTLHYSPMFHCISLYKCLNHCEENVWNECYKRSGLPISSRHVNFLLLNIKIQVKLVKAWKVIKTEYNDRSYEAGKNGRRVSLLTSCTGICRKNMTRKTTNRELHQQSEKLRSYDSLLLYTNLRRSGDWWW